MPEETAGAGASTSRPQIPLLDNAGEYGRLYNYVKAVRELLGKGGEAYRRVKTQHPDIDSKIDSGNLRVINDIIFENSNLVGLGGIKREELAKIANYSKVLANAERSGNKIPSLNAVNNVKADYDNIMQEKLEQGRDSYQESKDKLKEIRKEKNKKNGKVVSRVVFGMLAAALALGLVAGFGLGVYGIVQTAMAASFTITSGFAVGGVAVALIAGRAIVKGLGALFRKISSSFKKANAERKEAKAKFKAAKREMNQNRRNDLSNQYARARDNESELISPYPGSEGISTISRSREATVDMVSASELSAISGEFAAERAAREAAERAARETAERAAREAAEREASERAAREAAEREAAKPLTPMQEFENKYGSDMVRAIESSYNFHFKPSGRTATTIKKEDMAPAYSALLNDVTSAVRMGDTKSELSVNVPVMIDDYLKARGVEISRKKAKDPDIEPKDSHVTKLKPDVAVEPEEAPKAPVVKAPVVEEKKPETPEKPKTEPKAPAAGERTDDEIVADMIKKTTEEPAKEQEKKDATEDATKKVAKVEAEPEDDGWQELTENALKAGVPEELLSSMKERGMSAEDAYKNLKQDFAIDADKDGDEKKEDSDEPDSGA